MFYFNNYNLNFIKIYKLIYIYNLILIIIMIIIILTLIFKTNSN